MRKREKNGQERGEKGRREGVGTGKNDKVYLLCIITSR